jgi:3-oxosteroid 1-dehydrogenase
VPADALEATVERWNANVAAGSDPDHGRGESHHDRAWGDTTRFGETREATLGPIDTPPYYAVQVRVGALGTKGGPQTDGDARVLDVDGAPLPGLYAAGNAMASVMGMTYGGHGGTLGPALVFGYRAGRDAADRARQGAAFLVATSRP